MCGIGTDAVISVCARNVSGGRLGQGDAYRKAWNLSKKSALIL